MSAIGAARTTVALPSGERVPALGMGTWNMGDDPAARAGEIAALRLGLDLGLALVDTAEMYGDGRAESLVGEAVAGRRDEVFLVSKVYPHNASAQRMARSCEASLRRLGTDRIDLYLLHWRGGVPLAETVGAFEALRRAGKVRHWGVSNLDTADMRELAALPGGEAAATDQVLHHLGCRGPEYDLLPWLRARRIPAMAYSPVGQGALLADPRLAGFARRQGMTPAQAALAWLLARGDTIAIPKTASATRMRENAAARDIALSAQQLAELDRLFPPPDEAVPLEMI